MTEPELQKLASDMLKALVAISTNPHLNLDDRIYDVREAEGHGWDGPAVVAWSNAVCAVKQTIKDAKRLGMTLPIPD